MTTSQLYLELVLIGKDQRVYFKQGQVYIPILFVKEVTIGSTTEERIIILTNENPDKTRDT